MTTPATTTAPVAQLPQVVIDQGRFEGMDVDAVSCTLAGASKLVPEAGDHDDTVLTVGDIVTIQIDVKVSGIYYDVDSNGLLVRNQRVRPLEGAMRVMDVVRRSDTRIR